MPIPDRRTMIVLGSLIGAMTIAAGLLMLLEPRPVAPLTGISLTSLDERPESRDVLFATNPAPQLKNWGAIVIHHSGTTSGSARSIGQLHEQMGITDGLGYHFVIGNGRGSGDGQIEMGYRWRHQLPGVHASGPDNIRDWYNKNAIAICVVGDGDQQTLTTTQLRELVWLVQQLQVRLRIPPSRIFLNSDIAQTTSPGKLFPVARFRQQLLPIPEPR